MPSVHAVILNYRRPANIGRIVTACLDVGAIEKIHVIDQADDQHRLRQFAASPAVVIKRMPNIGAGRRLTYAADLSCDWVIAIDDDLFLTPHQIERLIAQSLADPVRVHGAWGQVVIAGETGFALRPGIISANRPVDILNRLYSFSPDHARHALELADRLGLQRDNLGPVDDILLSFAMPDPPMCHDLGTLDECPTSNASGIAVWKEPDFDRPRIDVLRKLGRMGFRPPRARSRNQR